MGAAASRLLGIEGDEQIGRARSVGGRGRLLVPPKWWLCILTYQVPLWCTVGFLSSPARRHAWVAAGCALCLGAVTGFLSSTHQLAQHLPAGKD
ncbi:hypothetical protein DIPPA_11811 [Diplonema papillatum]|nr:hypothetical protein DIPPA_11811 [Diplonema papillatum]